MKITKIGLFRKEPITQEIDVTQEQISAWKGGMLIQNAMPNLTADEREFIMTGTLPEEWDSQLPNPLENGCVKTGCMVWSVEYHEWVYGDAFHFDGTLIIHACLTARGEPMSDRKHFTINKTRYWLDKLNTDIDNNSTWISQDFVFHGHEGIPV